MTRFPVPRRTPSRRRSLAGLGVVLVGLLVGALPLGLGPLGTAAAATYPPLTVTFDGPTTVGTLLSANYTIAAAGGPAVAENGTTVGSYTYVASFTAANTTGLAFGPASRGVLTNGSVTLKFSTGNSSEAVTLAVLITSTYAGTNATKNVTLLVNVVQPYVLATNLVVGSGASVGSFRLYVSLDGAVVGSVAVPPLTAGTSYPVSFRYVDPSIAPGWHTFELSLVSQHGLVTFPGGQQTYSQSFYVAPPAPDYTLWVVTGVVAFVGAILIWSMRVGARRRGKGRK